MHTVISHKLGKQARLIIIMSVSNQPLGNSQRACIITQLRLLKVILSLLGRWEAGAAENNYCIFNTLFGLIKIRLEHFQLNADATCLTA